MALGCTVSSGVHRVVTTRLAGVDTTRPRRVRLRRPGSLRFAQPGAGATHSEGVPARRDERVVRAGLTTLLVPHRRLAPAGRARRRPHLVMPTWTVTARWASATSSFCWPPGGPATAAAVEPPFSKRSGRWASAGCLGIGRGWPGPVTRSVTRQGVCCTRFCETRSDDSPSLGSARPTQRPARRRGAWSKKKSGKWRKKSPKTAYLTLDV